MSAPKRIQRKRTKGWKMPVHAVYVGRPTRWGNPYVAWMDDDYGWFVMDDGIQIERADSKAEARAFAAQFHREDLLANGLAVSQGLVVLELAGKDLACWCPLDQPCHADVLLELANGGTS